MATIHDQLHAFEKRGTYDDDGLAWLDGERVPDFDIAFDVMERDPECLSKMRGPAYDAERGF